MAQDNDAEISTKFSTLNVNAMEFVPSGFAASPIPPPSSTITNTNSHQENDELQAAAPPLPTIDQPTQPPLSLPLDKIEDLSTPNNGKMHP